jgi:hypothetical protein
VIVSGEVDATESVRVPHSDVWCWRCGRSRGVCLDQYHLGDLASTLVCYGEVSSAVRCAVEARAIEHLTPSSGAPSSRVAKAPDFDVWRYFVECIPPPRIDIFIYTLNLSVVFL